MYVYLLTETNPNLYTVGFYDPEGVWHSESDHETKREATARVVYLNGGDYRNEDELNAVPDPEEGE